MPFACQLVFKTSSPSPAVCLPLVAPFGIEPKPAGLQPAAQTNYAREPYLI
jgi:hypothetical protein